MATVQSRPRRHSRGNGVYPAKAYPELMDWFHTARPHMPEAAAQMTLTGLDIMESWLAATRQMLDLWKEGIRDQQDSMLSACRHQIVATLAHDIEEEAARPARRRPPAHAAPKSNNAHTGATRH